jgi:hypothetical protein
MTPKTAGTACTQNGGYDAASPAFDSHFAFPSVPVTSALPPSSAIEQYTGTDTCFRRHGFFFTLDELGLRDYEAQAQPLSLEQVGIDSLGYHNLASGQKIDSLGSPSAQNPTLLGQSYQLPRAKRAFTHKRTLSGSSLAGRDSLGRYPTSAQPPTAFLRAFTHKRTPSNESQTSGSLQGLPEPTRRNRRVVKLRWKSSELPNVIGYRLWGRPLGSEVAWQLLKDDIGRIDREAICSVVDCTDWEFCASPILAEGETIDGSANDKKSSNPCSPPEVPLPVVDVQHKAHRSGKRALQHPCASPNQQEAAAAFVAEMLSISERVSGHSCTKLGGCQQEYPDGDHDKSSRLADLGSATRPNPLLVRDHPARDSCSKSPRRRRRASQHAISRRHSAAPSKASELAAAAASDSSSAFCLTPLNGCMPHFPTASLSTTSAPSRSVPKDEDAEFCRIIEAALAEPLTPVGGRQRLPLIMDDTLEAVVAG